MQNKDLGLDKENVVSVYTRLWYNVAGFKQELLRNPNVKSISMGAPIESLGEGEAHGDGSLFRWTNIDGQEDSLKMVIVFADGDFSKTFGLELIKGKLLESDFGKYW